MHNTLFTLTNLKNIFKSKNDIRASQITANLQAVCGSQNRFARMIGKSPAAVSQEINGANKSKFIRDKINEVTGNDYFQN